MGGSARDNYTKDANMINSKQRCGFWKLNYYQDY